MRGPAFIALRGQKMAVNLTPCFSHEGRPGTEAEATQKRVDGYRAMPAGTTAMSTRSTLDRIKHLES